MQPLDADEPRAIGGYRLLGRLGAGGMGRVYLGRSAGGRTVAVKIVHPHFAMDEEFRTRFRREVAAARRVGGEWTAPVLDADPDASVPWVATGYVAGPSLDRAVAAHGPLPETAVRAMGAGLAEALAAVHALGLVHRDVKPSNVMLTLDGPRLIDFGIARATEGTASLTSTGVSIGSPGYMAPEQILGKGTTAAADVFSLGAVLAFAATGAPPYTGDNSATLLYKVVHEEPELGLVPSDALRQLIAACLAKDPAARPAPAALAAALAPAGAGAALGPGWLPAALVEEVSRAAVALLHLDAAPDDPRAGTGTGSGTGADPRSPYGFGGPGGGPAPAATPADAVPAYASGPYAPGGSYGPAGGSFGAVAGPEEAATGTGREVSVRARAGRRLSCTVVLAVAGAMAAVTLGGLFAMDLLPGQGKDDGGGPAASDGGPRPAASSGSSPSTSSSPSTGGGSGDALPGRVRETVPESMTGTWKGTITTKNLGVPVDFQITIRAGRTGEELGRDKSVLDLLGTEYDCSGDWKLAAATDRGLRFDTAGGPNPHPGVCADGSSDERFTLNEDGTLHYRSGDTAAGNPEGNLTRS
ncbi:serine/threonine-protein kinase [Streptomyces sp. NPDC089919]|uniref:serine/threonine-protein kinase n=1 Tax=Streptomyces sp. NPDC089919 TaxID=3155188 RepID=UPI00341FFC96